MSIFLGLAQRAKAHGITDVHFTVCIEDFEAGPPVNGIGKVGLEDAWKCWGLRDDGASTDVCGGRTGEEAFRSFVAHLELPESA